MGRNKSFMDAGMNLQWEILGIDADENGLITSANYRVTARGYEQVAQSEGHWYFTNPMSNIPYESIRQQDIIVWIEKADESGSIAANLERQLLALNKESTALPWMKNAFQPFKE